ncbi:TIGR03986 family CRISPR-associated RAMP protein [Ferrovum myxofaciens]|jgi:CRISPR-associated protein (TIGR03986 family)|uniref:TIGR03986 family CRISPR-associated RAMP protein n=2 Tax=Ferrovum myxofaciens TaxID=416213 RepID=A0A9E6SWX8_9PROT|nr:TIGR03986 family CRISPR-associated RAMP protein [Ferrovum myxofaciens]QWY74026.1 MAG: TIGR03986 family CRISPR-associated RAMP protein [Ferrovum myxofaciens]QWY76778.1 MAG: TIGR03986 family CRISPR-associated RAMP protein [Ferrovum myxofaciens]
MISAPYNFVPLANWVHIPEWSTQVSHDWPFQDGVSGELSLTLTTHTPLLVGGQQTKAEQDKPGEVTPFQLPGGRYAIPGSSIKGMLRAVIEIAGFGRMHQVDEQRPALRDITQSDSIYATRIQGKIKTGFLSRTLDGKQEIHPCKMVRLNHRDLEQVFKIPKPIFERGSVTDKYRRWKELCATRKRDPQNILFDVDTTSKVATNLYQGKIPGTPVFTGQINESTQKTGKSKDFIFHNDTKPPISVQPKEWADFLRIHGDEEKRDEMSWPGYWKREYRAGKKVPVFYLQDEGLLRIGLAYMPKLAGDFSTWNMIDHSSTKHRAPPGQENGYDFADLLFGALGSEPTDALRGRVSCETLLCSSSNPSTTPQPPTILNGPKPSYFPNYLTQKDADPETWKLKKPNGQYVTYLETTNSSTPTLRGYKRYPTRPLDQTKVQPLDPEQKNNSKVQIQLHTLPSNIQFAGRIVFHNLKELELGALLWALTWGNNQQLRHGLGMGKSFGFGQISLALDYSKCKFFPNDPVKNLSSSSEQVESWMDLFTEHMKHATQKQEGKDWNCTTQLLNLLAMADPDSATRLPKKMELRHMSLSKKEFTESKKEQKGQLVLADYAIASGRCKPENWHPPQGTAVRKETPKVTPNEQQWSGARVTYNKNSEALTVKKDNQEATASQPEGKKLFNTLPQDLRKKIETNQFVKVKAIVSGKILIGVELDSPPENTKKE